MYLPFYGLAEKPFSITPDPRYLYLGGHHAEALAHLLYGITEAGGFIQLTGEVGTGKTTMIRSLLARRPENAEIALILNPRMSELEFMQTICEELRIAVPDAARDSMKELTGLLNRHLLLAHASGRRVVLIVDEAQNLTPELLERVRLLTNLETETQKLLQIILIGQPELRAMLARNDLRQLAQRITGRYHLDPLSREETAAYVKHRLRIAGATREIFTAGALKELHRASGGFPRLINIIGDRALLGGFTEDRHVQNAAMVRRAAGEVFGRRVESTWLPWVAGTAAAALLCTGTWLVWSRYTAATPALPAAVAAAPEVQAEAPAPAPAAEAPQVASATSLARLLQQSIAPGSADTAWSHLFSLWNAQFMPGMDDPCAQAMYYGLDCLEEGGGAAVLARYNRPAVVTLEDGSGALHHAVFAQLAGGQRARLMLGPDTHDLSLDELEGHWDGNFVLLWRSAVPLQARNLSLGMWSDAVRDLRARLNTWAGLADDPSIPQDYFDEALRELVMRFQAGNGLVVDGIAGARTRALLDATLADIGTPLLSAAVR